MTCTYYIKTAILLLCFYFLRLEGRAQHFIGIREGVSISGVLFNPSRRDSTTVQWKNVGLTYKYYNAPWTGLQMGLNYAEKGYVLNDTTRRYTIVELPLLSQFHYELWQFRILANAGAYLSYMLRAEDSYIEQEETVYRPYLFGERDNRIEYGMHIGGGFAFMWHPLEIHFEIGYQYGFSYLIKPKYKEEPTMFTHATQLIFSGALFLKL